MWKKRWGVREGKEEEDEEGTRKIKWEITEPVSPKSQNLLFQHSCMCVFSVTFCCITVRRVTVKERKA